VQHFIQCLVSWTIKREKSENYGSGALTAQSLYIHFSRLFVITQEELTNGLREAGAVADASELHGYLVGRLITGHTLHTEKGLQILADYLGISREDLAPLESDLSQMALTTNTTLDQDVFSFRLLLPDDDMAISARLEALSDWCQGFLVGIGSSAGLGTSKVMEEDSDVVSDLVAITQISCDEEDSEDNENMFFEVSDYVRLAVLQLFDQCRLTDGESVSTGADVSVH